MKKKILITDIDNTLFDWFSMWHHSFSAMTEKLSILTGVELESLYPEIKRIYQIHGTAEYAFLLEELLPWINSQAGEIFTIEDLRPAIEAYREARSEYMVLYPQVMETLETLKSSGCFIVAFSESKRFYSSYRIKKLGLDGIVQVIYCPDDHALPDAREATYPLNYSECRLLPANFKKPNREILLKILLDLGFGLQDALYVGDSRSKDIKMAVEAGVDYLWFEAGATHLNTRIDDYELLRKVTHWSDAEVEMEKALALNMKELNVPESRKIQSYSEILKYF